MLVGCVIQLQWDLGHPQQLRSSVGPYFSTLVMMGSCEHMMSTCSWDTYDRYSEFYQYGKCLRSRRHKRPSNVRDIKQSDSHFMSVSHVPFLSLSVCVGILGTLKQNHTHYTLPLSSYSVFLSHVKHVAQVSVSTFLIFTQHNHTHYLLAIVCSSVILSLASSK